MMMPPMSEIVVSNASAVFPPTTTVKAYPIKGTLVVTPSTGAPAGSSGGEAEVEASGKLTITGLTEGTHYLLAAEVSGAWRYLQVYVETSGEVVTIAPTAGTDGLTLVAPKYPDDTFYLLRLEDTPTTYGRLLQIEHNGEPHESKGAVSQNYGLEIHNFPGANAAQVIHQYSGAAPALWIDNTSSANMVRLKNTQNPNTSPGTHGTGAYLEFDGYSGSTKFTDGAMTAESAVLKAATSEPFINSDVGKNISVVGAGPAAATLVTTIASYVSASEVTLTVAASTGVSGASFEYATTANIKALAYFDNTLKWESLTSAGIKFTTSAGLTSALTVTQAAGGGAAAVGLFVQQKAAAVAAEVLSESTGGIALKVTQNANQLGLWITQKSTQPAVQINQEGAATALTLTTTEAAQGLFVMKITGWDYGPKIETSANGGNTLVVAKNSTGNGIAVLIQDKGTGPALSIEVGETPAVALQVLASGQIKFAKASNEATGAGSALLGANSPAVTNTAPYTWEKVTTSDGSQGFIPVWR